ncbi:MAG: molybdate ABC transporter substrate-binding protein [Acidobacteriota bacterium]|nr:molybdate ABC transporter substrate-binding protein [Acidobacteriota bacterium]
MRQNAVIVPVTVLAAILAAWVYGGCGTPVVGTDGLHSRAELVVFAAASLAQVARDLGAEFEERQDIRVIFNFAGSNTLAQQISVAGLADVFLSADADWARFLENRGRALPGSLRPLFSNRLVIIGHRSAAFSIDEPGHLLRRASLGLPNYRYLAVADPRGVPAGRYARRRLQGLDAPDGDSLWDALADRMAPTLDVRAALTLVESDPQILGFVYRTDAAASPHVRVLYEFPADPEQPIAYWGVQVAESGQPAAARAFLDFLETESAADIVRRHGFESFPTGIAR